MNGFGVWEGRDNDSIPEQRAQSGSKLIIGYIFMVSTSAILATGGLLLNNPTVVIGLMCNVYTMTVK